ncbi:MAG: hypothetical protein R3E98_02625 [Gemmatimonadota bacterium]
MNVQSRSVQSVNAAVGTWFGAVGLTLSGVGLRHDGLGAGSAWG